MDNSRNICEAKCTNGCSNGVCVGPERCECLPGYFATSSAINSKKSICTPYCKSKCVNAYCIKPNVCQCITGYRFAENSTSVCEPICDDSLVDCANGRCTQPNVCECDEGFVLAIRDGKMVCDPKPCDRLCVNGLCIGEGVCECLEGYRPSAKYDYICEPVCEPGCNNGVCIAPNMCVCKEGFVAKEDGSCEAVCNPAVVDCTNGDCVGSDQCQCNSGYYPQIGAEGVTECVPLCTSSCSNGHCVAPGVCECNDGYRFNDLDICEAICDPPCEFGTCVEPDYCVCNEGFVPENEDFFEQNPVCIPLCDPLVVNCSNGVCGGNNFCRCHVGFYTSYTSEGVMTCLPVPEPEPIVECTTPYVEPAPSCECDTSCPEVECPTFEPPTCNYTCPTPPPCPTLTCPTTPTPPTTTQAPPCECPTQPPCPQQTCPPPIIPECNPASSEELPPQIECDRDYVNCAHGTCLGNNVCECDDGYQRAIGDRGVIVCEPVCETPCIDGTCVAPNVCECFDGYADDGYGRCEPVCDEPCVNAVCVAPHVCRCLEGYEEEWDGMCRKMCVPDCKNGVCQDGECVCEEGQVLTVDNACEDPVEVEEIQTVVESEPLEKIQSRFSFECEDGYEFSEEDGDCIPICDNCENGTCAGPGHCVCHEGFVRTYIDGAGSCTATEPTTEESMLAELQAPQAVLVERDESRQSGFWSMFNGTHLLIAIVVASTALVIMFASYWVCTYLKRESPVPTETVID
uniref:von Willebrand factor D and EGF domain-containing protein n=4 Tax=Culex pipiens TaxID=7175 RepID=A0A8D8CJ39_CULPI